MNTSKKLSEKDKGMRHLPLGTTSFYCGLNTKSLKKEKIRCDCTYNYLNQFIPGERFISYYRARVSCSKQG